MREVALRPRAAHDLESIYLYGALVLHEPQAASRLVDQLYEAFERLAEFPQMGEACDWPELENRYRRFLVGKHWVYYTFDDDALTIWRIFHAAEDIDDFALVDWE